MSKQASNAIPLPAHTLSRAQLRYPTVTVNSADSGVGGKKYYNSGYGEYVRTYSSNSPAGSNGTAASGVPV